MDIGNVFSAIKRRVNRIVNMTVRVPPYSDRDFERDQSDEQDTSGTKKLTERLSRHEGASTHVAEYWELVMLLFPLPRSQKKPTALMAWAAMSSGTT